MSLCKIITKARVYPEKIHQRRTDRQTDEKNQYKEKEDFSVQRIQKTKSKFSEKLRKTTSILFEATDSLINIQRLYFFMLP